MIYWASGMPQTKKRRHADVQRLLRSEVTPFRGYSLHLEDGGVQERPSPPRQASLLPLQQREPSGSVGKQTTVTL